MATTGIAHERKLHVPGNVQVIGGDAFELIRNRSGLRFRSNPAHYCPDNVTDFALSGCEDGVAGDIDCPTISPSVISTAVLRTLEFAFSFAIKAACTCNTVAISLCILLSRLSIVSIRFQVRTLLLIRTATTTRAQIANAMYSAVIKRESARSTISRNLSYSMRSTPQDRYPDYYQAMLAICRQQSGLVPSSERTGRGALANPPAGSPWQPVNNIPPVIWWNNLERILLAVDDLGCRDLL